MDLNGILTCCESLEQDIIALRMTERIEFDFYSEMIDAVKTIYAEIASPPKTNADRIRQMTDEELAEMLLLSTCYFGCNKCKHHGKCKGKSCTEAAVEWLKQEVSEDAGID